MKPYETQTLYELLEVDSAASADEIRQAFERAQALYGADSIAMYAVEDPAEAESFRGKLEEALQTLSDPEKRDAYDRMLGLPVRSRTPLRSEAQSPSRVPPQPAPPAADQAEGKAPTQLAMTEMLARAESSHSTHPEYQISYIPKRPPAAEAKPEEVPVPVPAKAEERPAPTPVTTPVARVTAARQYDVTPEIAQETAIATAEAAMAEVSARVREAAVTKPKPFELPPDATFNGELLRRVRESKGLSLAQVSDRTRISKSHLENIEADRYAPLPATVYLRGMLASLSRELGLDINKVTKSYLSLVGDQNKAK